MIKQELINEFEELNRISSSTIARCLKKDLKYSYKILERKPAPTLTHDCTRRLLEGALIQKLLNEKKVELIYIDGFWVNTNHHLFRDGQKLARRVTTNETQVISLCRLCEVSQSIKFMDCMDQNQQLLLSIFEFILKIWSKWEILLVTINDKPFIIGYDNAPVHSNKTVVEFVSKSKLRTLSIPKYCPILNPAEKLINWIKSKLKSFQSWGKYLFWI